MHRLLPEKTEKSVIFDMLLMTLVLAFMSWFYYGWRALIVVAVSVASSYITDVICVKLRGEKYDMSDFSAVLAGILMALMMPASVPYHILILANIFAITLGKQFFGGKDKNIFNPTAVGFILSSICWKEAVLLYPKPNEVLSLASNTGAQLSVSFTQVLGYAATPSVSTIDILLGKFTGPMGATHVALLVVCAVILILRRSASALTFFGGVGTIAVVTYFHNIFGTNSFNSIFYELSSGMVLFGILFLACDCYTVPKTHSTRFIYGVLIGGLTILFQIVGKTENAVLYAIIIANPIGISLDESAFSFRAFFHEIKIKLSERSRKKETADK